MSFDVHDLGPAVLPWTQAFKFRSASLDRDFQIQVSWPLVPRAARAKLPVVFVLDGNHSFAMAAGAARSLQSGPFPARPTLVVGVGYHFERPEDHAQWGRLRVRDFTAGPDPLFTEQYGDAGGEPGGAAAFLAFLEDELTPFLAERLDADVSDRTLVGASLGGLFALWAMLTRPAAFRRIVAISPALFWGDRALFDLEAAFAATGQDIPVQLFLAAGGLEEAHDARQRFVSNLYAFDAHLRSRNHAGLRATLQVFDGENHMSVFPAAFTRGLGAVFGGYPDLSDWSRALRA